MSLLLLNSEQEYRAYFYENFCARPLEMRVESTVIKVFFNRDHFDHAFFESSQRDRVKDVFSTQRASHMSLIPQLLGDATGDRRAGWNAATKSYNHGRCVVLSAGDFVLVIRIAKTKRGDFRARFVTCYVADSSIGKIRKSPTWDFESAKKQFS